MKKLAISLLNRNGLQDTIYCVDSLLESDFNNFDIYLLDNGSKNNEYKELKQKYSKYSNIILGGLSENIGFTGGNNHNLEKIRKHKYDYIMLLNNDCKIEKLFLSNFMKHIEKIKQPGIFGPIIKGYDNSIQSIGSYINLYTGSSKRLKKISSEIQKVDYVTGSCMVVSAEIFQKIGILDDRFFAYWEESDYSLRASEQGYNTYALNIEGIYHKEESAQKKIKPYYTYLMFRNRLLFLKKHANILQYISSWLFFFAYILFLFPNHFGVRNYKYLFKGIKDGILGNYGKQDIT